MVNGVPPHGLRGDRCIRTSHNAHAWALVDSRGCKGRPRIVARLGGGKPPTEAGYFLGGTIKGRARGVGGLSHAAKVTATPERIAACDKP